MVNEDPRGRLGLVMSGGGARAAYQVGILRWLARRYVDLRVPILTGVSAGAINAAFLASHREDFRSSVEELADLWGGLTVEDVVRTDLLSFARNILRLGLKLCSGSSTAARSPHAAVDTRPLWGLLGRALGARGEELPGIEENIRRGSLRAIAITTSSYTTGQSVTWVQGRGVPLWERAHRKSIHARLGVRHVMASAALPVLFPAVEIDGQWFGDGGIRITAPLSPAVHLGASRILAISTNHSRSCVETDRGSVNGYPPPAQIMGTLLNAAFLDLFDADALSLERVNEAMAALPPERRGDYRRIKLLLLRPSRDLAGLASEHEARFGGALRLMTRGLGTGEARSNDLLSMLMFQPDYLTRLIELGEEDAETRRRELEDLLEEAPIERTRIQARESAHLVHV